LREVLTKNKKHPYRELKQQTSALKLGGVTGKVHVLAFVCSKITAIRIAGHPALIRGWAIGSNVESRATRPKRERIGRTAFISKLTGNLRVFVHERFTAPASIVIPRGPDEIVGAF
jgi:hypothetical protein